MTFGPALGGYAQQGNFQPSSVVVYAQFRVPQPDGSYATMDVTNPRVRVTRESALVRVQSLESRPDDDGIYPLIQIGTGLYRFAFLSTSQPPGLIDFEFSGEAVINTVSTTIVVKGTVGLGEISRLQDVINRVQVNLMDDHPEDYRLDEPVNQWRKLNLFEAVRTSLDRFNVQGPRQTAFTFDTIPSDYFLVTGGVIQALYQRARLEKANEMSYSDGHSLDIKRADFYLNMAKGLETEWLEAVKGWKQSTPPSPIGLKSQRLPFRINRVIGLLPNYQTFFNGTG